MNSFLVRNLNKAIYKSSNDQGIASGGGGGGGACKAHGYTNKLLKQLCVFNSPVSLRVRIYTASIVVFIVATQQQI